MMKKIKNEHLLPEIILNMIKSYENAKDSSNEKYAMFQRLEAIRDAMNMVLERK